MMKTRTKIASALTLLITATLASVPPGAAAPCTEGDLSLVYQSGTYTVPTNGFYWNDGTPAIAGDSFYVEVFLHNYVVGQTCVLGPAAYLREGSAAACGPQGPSGVLAGPATVPVPVGGVYMKPGDTHLYVGGYSTSPSVQAENAPVGEGCAAIVGVQQSPQVAWEVCVTCAP